MLRSGLKRAVVMFLLLNLCLHLKAVHLDFSVPESSLHLHHEPHFTWYELHRRQDCDIVIIQDTKEELTYS